MNRNGRAADDQKARRRGKLPGENKNASLRAYKALLNADHWLLEASMAVSTSGSPRKQGRLEAIRKSIAAQMEVLQRDAYEALNKSGN